MIKPDPIERLYVVNALRVKEGLMQVDMTCVNSEETISFFTTSREQWSNVIGKAVRVVFDVVDCDQPTTTDEVAMNVTAHYADLLQREKEILTKKLSDLGITVSNGLGENKNATS